MVIAERLMSSSRGREVRTAGFCVFAYGLIDDSKVELFFEKNSEIQ